MTITILLQFMVTDLLWLYDAHRDRKKCNYQGVLLYVGDLSILVPFAVLYLFGTIICCAAFTQDYNKCCCLLRDKYGVKYFCRS